MNHVKKIENYPRKNTQSKNNKTYKNNNSIGKHLNFSNNNIQRPEDQTSLYEEHNTDEYTTDFDDIQTSSSEEEF